MGIRMQHTYTTYVFIVGHAYICICILYLGRIGNDWVKYLQDSQKILLHIFRVLIIAG